LSVRAATTLRIAITRIGVVVTNSTRNGAMEPTGKLPGDGQAQVRVDFLQPGFSRLGAEIDLEKQRADAGRCVQLEVRIGDQQHRGCDGFSKRPDPCHVNTRRQRPVHEQDEERVETQLMFKEQIGDELRATAPTEALMRDIHNARTLG